MIVAAYRHEYKKSVLGVLVPFLLLLFTLVLSSCESPPGPSPTPTASGGSSTPTLAPTATTGGTGSIKDAVHSYYQAVQAQNYTQAYSSLDADATTTEGQKLTPSLFSQMAENSDHQFGPVVSYDILVDTANPMQVIMTISRKAGLRYHAHLTLKEEGDTWKILTLDRI